MYLIALVAAASVSIVHAGLISATWPGADGSIVGNVSVEHEIKFGSSIAVRMEADVVSPVSEVRAVFAPTGDRRVSSYAYPEFSIDPTGRRLNSAFEISTGGGAYVPPGTEFELFFELTGTDGTVSITEPERFLYLDPEKNWQVLSSPTAPLDIHYYGFGESTAEVIEERVASAWESIAQSVGLDPVALLADTRFRAVIYPNLREASPAFPPTSAAATDGSFFGGFAMQRYGVFMLGGPWPDSVIHELTHLLVDTRVSSPLTRGVPSWLHEGLAQFFEAGSSRRYTSQIESAAGRDDLLTLRNRNTVPSRSSEIGLFYSQVGSFVGQLIEDSGPQPMARTLGLINDGVVAADAIEIAYARPLWQLENDWRARLGASALPPPPEPEPVDRDSLPSAAATVSPPPQTEPTRPVGQDGEVPAVGVVIDPAAPGETTDPDGSSPDRFNWTGPLIGAALAGAVFFIWSFRVNRRRFGSYRDRGKG